MRRPIMPMTRPMARPMMRMLLHPLRQRFVAAAFVLAAITSCFAAPKRPPAKPLDLNAATAAQLQQLPGVGPGTAQEIVRFREKSGPFQRVEDLLAIRGISKVKLEKLRPYVFVKSKPI
jgi:competence ComEA-like helix-hairpin-helix protein